MTEQGFVPGQRVVIVFAYHPEYVGLETTVISQLMLARTRSSDPSFGKQVHELDIRHPVTGLRLVSEPQFLRPIDDSRSAIDWGETIDDALLGGVTLAKVCGSAATTVKVAP